ncbi:MAG: nuclear transport factor 2 family protein [Devosia sp.]
MFVASERGDRDSLLALHTEDAVQIEHPNRLKTKRDRRAPAKIAEDLARGKTILRSEHYEIVNAAASGDAVALQVEWTGVLGVPIGALGPGDQMTTFSGIFPRFREEQIAEQINCDCFEDFLAPKEPGPGQSEVPAQK